MIKFLCLALLFTIMQVTAQDVTINDVINRSSNENDLSRYGSNLSRTNSDLKLQVPSYSTISTQNFNDNISNELILDNYIDSAEYMVGPGDSFLVYIWGSEKKVLSVTISAEGSALLPMIGVVSLKTQNLADAKDIIGKKVNEVYKDVKVTVILSKIRKFKTYIHGEISKKGSYFVNGNTRVSDLVTTAGGITDRGKHRGITIDNQLLKQSKFVDLSILENNSDFKYNPYLVEGDRVFIPPKKEIIQISGGINYPGIYDHVENDCLLDVINIAGGFSRGADSTRVSVYRYGNNVDSVITINVDLEDFVSFTLRPDDRIVVGVLPSYRINLSVVIRGEVNCPGDYPIRKNRSTLSEIIKLAGGLKESAEAKTLKIVRDRHAFPGEREYDKLKSIPQNLQYPNEQSYYLAKLTEGELTLNFDSKDLLNGKGDAIILEDGDTIEVKEKVSSIKVLGGVVRPGLVIFEKGRDVSYYVSQCGGFLPNSKSASIRIIKSGSDQKYRVTNTLLESGDVIWVPEKRNTGLTAFKDWVTIVGTVATTLLAIFAIKDNL